MNINTENSLTIFTDGSSLGNPGPGGWGVIMVYPRLNEVIELGGTKLQTTNNEMELTKTEFELLLQQTLYCID